jgi:hypothetical protein
MKRSWNTLELFLRWRNVWALKLQTSVELVALSHDIPADKYQGKYVVYLAGKLLLLPF